MNLDPGPGCDIAGLDAVLDGRVLADTVDAEVDHMASVMCFDLDQTAVTIQDKRHGDDRLERVALGAAGRADIGFA